VEVLVAQKVMIHELSISQNKNTYMVGAAASLGRGRKGGRKRRRLSYKHSHPPPAAKT
jgi:hypothetical protein